MDKVNETTRREDNRQAVVDLSGRVEDWKQHDITTFGELLLKETFFVIKNDSEREYNVYLFERIILCCKESGSSGKKSSKSNSILKKPASKKPTSLQLKGRIFVNNVTGAAPANKNGEWFCFSPRFYSKIVLTDFCLGLFILGQCLLEVRWRGDVAEEAFTIKCRTEELLRQWQKAIMKAVDESPNRRRAHHLSSSRRSERSLNSPLSQFPATPLTESGPTYYPSESTSPYPYMSSAQPAYPPNSNGFDDEGDDYYDHESGRSTPSTMARRGLSMRSMPGGDSSSSSGRPALNRPPNEMSSSAAINQWRSQTPATASSSGSLPGLPRGVSITSNGSDGQSLRSSASSRHLRNNQSVEYSGGTSPVLNGSRLPNGYSPASSHQQLREYTNDEDTTPRPNGVTRQTSHAVAPSSYPAPPMLRNRSTSSPIVYQSPNLAGSSSGLNQQHQQLSSPAEDWRSYPDQQQQQQQNHQQHRRLNSNGQSVGSSMQHLTLSKSHATNSGGTLASASSASTAKRFSSSSAGTDRSSGTSSQSAGATYTASTSPATTLPPSSALPALPSHSRHYSSALSGNQLQQQQPPPPSSSASPPSAIRVKVTFGEDTFVVVVLSSVSYKELLEKVLKKIRLCGGEKSRVEGAHLRLRYRDEDGDKILITSGEDVTMAFEAVKANSVTGTQTLVLFVSVDT